MLKALIFDVDGTLADTEKDGHRVAFNLAFKAANLSWHWNERCYGDLLAVTGGKERMRFYAEQYDPAFLAQKNAHQIIIDLHARKTRYYVELLSQGKIPLRPGVERLLNEARAAKLTLAIATTTTPENVTALIENTLGAAAMNWFQCIGAGDIVPEKKPAADIYEYVLKRLNLSAKECIAFEDSENGTLSAQGANLATIITTNDYTLDHNFKDAVLVLNQYGEANNPATVITGKMTKPYLDLASIRAIHEAKCPAI
ncbi:MAG: HAD-IA family hydrolase [Arenicellales bacterium]